MVRTTDINFCRVSMMSYCRGGIGKESRDSECDLEEMGKNIRDERSQESAKSQPRGVILWCLNNLAWCWTWKV